MHMVLGDDVFAENRSDGRVNQFSIAERQAFRPVCVHLGTNGVVRPKEFWGRIGQQHLPFEEIASFPVELVEKTIGRMTCGFGLRHD